ncbi:MAG: type 4a pilus biogenesis protein PilO [Deltaproteobacteria bacterium]|nr:type 4a pilus biogenesis protein PilO [Deltaproteobacteria bacterium]
MKKIGISLEALEPFFDKVGKLTQVQRILICCAAFLIVIGGFVYLSFLPKFKQIDTLEKEFEELSQQLVAAKQKASELDKYRKEFAEAEIDFEKVKKSLPEERDIPKLLATVSSSGQEAGMDFLLFEPKKEQKKEFYASIPVAIEVEGTYQNLETFFDKVSRLPRIVNIEKIRIKPRKGSDEIRTTCRAITYRFIETKAQEKKK